MSFTLRFALMNVPDKLVDDLVEAWLRSEVGKIVTSPQPPVEQRQALIELQETMLVKSYSHWHQALSERLFSDAFELLTDELEPPFDWPSDEAQAEPFLGWRQLKRTLAKLRRR